MKDDLEDFERLVAALRPWLSELVVVGGWAHRLHHEHPLAKPPAYLPVRTRDADLAFGELAKLHGRPAQALKDAGFREELSTEERPPVAQYHLGADDKGFYAEFIAPLRGSGTKRDGSADATVVRGGVVAQKLRYVDLLLIEPWSIRIGGEGSEHIPEPCEVLVANPVCFIVQKLLIHDLRVPGKRSQDVLYIHDTLQLFGVELQALAELWREKISGLVSGRQLSALKRARAEIFGDVTDVIRNAARIPADRTLRPAEIRTACAHGLDVLFSQT